MDKIDRGSVYEALCAERLVDPFVLSKEIKADIEEARRANPRASSVPS